MTDPRQPLAFLAAFAISLGAAGTAGAGDTLKGSVQGSVSFADGQGPMKGFQTADAVGKVSHLGRTLAAMEMVPRLPDAKGAPTGFIGSARLTAADGDVLDMFIAAGPPVISNSPDGSVTTASFTGHYRMDGGTGRFADSSSAGAMRWRIECDWSRRRWTIYLDW